MYSDSRPLIAITLGDAAGIGPEVVVKALAGSDIYDLCRPFIIGESRVVRKAIELASEKLRINVLNGPDGAAGRYGTVDVLDMKNINPEKITTGKVSAEAGRASMEYIEKACALALAGSVRAIVTAPISKEATTQAGYRPLGHLEYLAELTGSKEYATMLMTGRLRVVHLTTHHSLRRACDLVTEERILARLKLTDASFKSWGFPAPKIAVAALNPHAGEGSILGSEETEEIAPAVEKARALGIDAAGPLPADSVFNHAINGRFDAVLAMYHDQGHIPVKVHGFEKSVSVALGLPFVRTSVDHGTAFDIAGKGIADAQSMAEAIRTAVYLSLGKGLPV